MKVLQINCVYRRGSTGKIVWDLHTSLQARGIQSVVCYGRLQDTEESNVYKTSSEFAGKFNNGLSRLTGLPYGGAGAATRRLLKIILREQPDVVHLQCINGFFVNIYRLVEFLKNSGIPTVLTLHAEFMYTGSCSHAVDCEKWKTGCGNCPQLHAATHSMFLDRTHTAWLKMKRAFDGFDRLTVVSVSPWVQSRAEQSPILAGKRHCTILNGIDTQTVFHPRDCHALREKWGITDEKVLLHVTADFKNPIKGGQHVLELARRLEKERIKIVVVGNAGHETVFPKNMIDAGRTENQEDQAAYYSMADLTVLTSRRETYSMICAESLSCGTPVVGFKAGGPEQISLGDYSEFVDYGDLDGLTGCIRRWIGQKHSVGASLAQQAGQVYSKENMCEEYVKIYEAITAG